MPLTVRNYQYRCLTENQTVTEWRTSVPTTCKHDGTHVIDTEGIVALGEVSEQIIKIQEESTPTGENIRVKTVGMTFGPGLGEQTITWEPLRTSVLSITASTDSRHEGDILDVFLNHNTPAGVLLAPATLGTTTLVVSDTVIQNILPGFLVTLGTEELGQVLSVGGDSITISSATTQAYEAGTVVQVGVQPVSAYEFGPPAAITWGEGKIGGMSVPPNSRVTMRYQNNGEVSKRLILIIEYLY